MNKLAVLTMSIIFSMIILPAMAGQAEETRYLLRYIEQSGCEFERNGAVHNAKDAKLHIQKKYDYVNSFVDTTEDFIKYAATKSSLSGKKYYVTCQGERQTTAQWLLSELSRYREKEQR